MLQQPPPLFTLAAAAMMVVVAVFTRGASGHAHDKQHSHFCEGGGYNLFCSEGLTLRVDRAWYGRLAHDKDSCLETGSLGGGGGGNNSSDGHDDNAAAAAAAAAAAVGPHTHHPDLAQDCGSSILDSKDSWCQNADKGGCTIAVRDLGHGAEGDRACPDTVTKYLYLEYECLGEGSGSSSAPAAVTLTVVKSLCSATLLLAVSCSIVFCHFL